MFRLEDLGWNDFFEKQKSARPPDDLVPVRVMEEQRGSYRVQGSLGLVYAEASGRLRRDVETAGALKPCVGDWALARMPGSPGGGMAVIHGVLERKSVFSRKSPGEETVEQVIAANVDTVFLVQSLNRNFNVRRLERYLALVWESGAAPVVVLSKADLCDDPDPLLDQVRAAATGVPVVITSSLLDGGLDGLAPYLEPGRTVALVGSSGVGKSTIVNRLLGEETLAVQDIRDDDRGRHTTTARRIVILPGGCLLLDTPGMRTVLMLETEEGLSRTFGDVEALAAGCRFHDCAHETEPGCGVREGLRDGRLDPSRWMSYQKLQREIRYVAGKTDVRLRLAEQERWKKIHRENRKRPDKRRI